MAKNYEITIDTHPNIYDKMSPRKLNIYFSEPDKGVDEETGILLLIAGFGGSSNSNVYKKMRSVFADKYNLITVQCDYFGWQYMQKDLMIETLSNFNDMGLLQALDNITSVIIISEILKDNNLTFNAGKIIAYGHSHGSYLAYLCNVFAPGLFSLIVDNSAWLFPIYFLGNRCLNHNGEDIVFDYIARLIIKDYAILHLPSLYKHFENNCAVHSFHGEGDSMISLNDKKDFCQTINKCILHEITKDKVDNRIFKSDTHGLDADFILLFESLLLNTEISFDSRHTIQIINQEIHTEKFSYKFNYNSIVPYLDRKSK